jgi:hypothetical protein
VSTIFWFGFFRREVAPLKETMLVGRLVRPSVGPQDKILQKGEGRGCGMMLKTSYVKMASRLVTVTCSCFLIPVNIQASSEKSTDAFFIEPVNVLF